MNKEERENCFAEIYYVIEHLESILNEDLSEKEEIRIRLVDAQHFIDDAIKALEKE